MYVVRHLHRLRTLTMGAPSIKAAGAGGPTGGAALCLRSAEPWCPAAREAIDRWAYIASVTESLPHRLAAAPFCYGVWDNRARKHAQVDERQLLSPAAEACYADFDMDVAALRELPVPGLLVLGELDPFSTLAPGTGLVAVMAWLWGVVLSGSGRFLLFDGSSACGVVVRRFLADQGAAARMPSVKSAR